MYKSHMTTENTIPSFALFGEMNGLPDLLHVERIAVRARPRDWGIPVHRHPALVQFLYVTQCGGIAHFDGLTRRFEAETAIFIPPLCAHGYNFDPDCDGLVMTLAPGTLADALRQNAQALASLTYPILLQADDFFAALAAQIAREHNRAEAYRSPVLLSAIALICLWFARRAEGAGLRLSHSPYANLAHRFLELVERHFRSERGLAFYAHHLARTPSHLNRACNRALGRSASTLIRERLMLEARRELAYTNRPIAEICYLLGYRDPPHFTRAFRLATGKTPKNFRAEMQAD